MKETSAQRKAVFHVLGGLVVLGIVFGAIWVPRALTQGAFLRETRNILLEVEHRIQYILDDSYPEEEGVAGECTRLSNSLAELETTLSNGHKFVSSDVPLPDELHGIPLVMYAIRGSLAGIPAMAEDGLSDQEKAFLKAFVEDVGKLLEACDVSNLWEYGGAIDNLRETYQAMNETWQLDGFRTPTGVSPFEALMVP